MFSQVALFVANFTINRRRGGDFEVEAVEGLGFPLLVLFGLVELFR